MDADAEVKAPRACVRTRIIRAVLGYDLWIDLAIGTGLLAIYHGSAHGMLIATLAGVIISIVLRFCRWFCGYERWSFARMRWEYHPY
jgi:hypothetical protein